MSTSHFTIPIAPRQSPIDQAMDIIQAIGLAGERIGHAADALEHAEPSAEERAEAAGLASAAAAGLRTADAMRQPAIEAILSRDRARGHALDDALVGVGQLVVAIEAIRTDIPTGDAAVLRSRCYVAELACELIHDTADGALQSLKATPLARRVAALRHIVGGHLDAAREALDRELAGLAG